VPFILLFQACCFLLPNVIWHTFSKSAGVDVTSLGKNAIALDNFDMERRGKTIDQIARHIHIALSLKYYNDDEPTGRFSKINIARRLPCGRRHGNWLYIVYMIVKIIYLLNIIGQLFLLNNFFGFQQHAWGFEFLKKFLLGEEDYSRIDKAFPRVTFCDFRIRNLADNIHQHSVQCALPINLFNEKFFICLWFWLIILTVITFVNFVSWFKVIFTSYRKKTMAKYLRSHNKLGTEEKDLQIFNSFITDYCHLDGAFIIEILRRNSNYITTSEILVALWSKYQREMMRSHQDVPRIIHVEGNFNNKDQTELAMIDCDEPEKTPFRS
jgi:hypothetical protein